MSPMNASLKLAFKRIGSSEIAPFAGLSLSDDEMALIKTCASAGVMFADGIVPLPAGGDFQLRK